MLQSWKKKLISLGTLGSNRCTYMFGEGVLRISKGALIVMKGKKINGLYTVQGSMITNATIVSISKSILDTTILWHMRLRHISKRKLMILMKWGLLGGQKKKKLDFYEHYVFEK